jgi:hypothetical protein
MALSSRARTKLWAQEASAEIELLRSRLSVITARIESFGSRTTRPWLLKEQRATRVGVEHLLCRAMEAVNGEVPPYRRFITWWSGNCIEAAFRNTHNAEALIARLYSPGEVRAEIPEAIRRAKESLTLDDPMRLVAKELLDARQQNGRADPEALSKVIEAGHAAADRQRSRLRIFRNVLITGFAVTSLLLVGLVMLAFWKPHFVPLCFVQDPPPEDLALPNVVCPVRSDRVADMSFTDVVSRPDFLVVATLGLMGGALSAALFIRDLYANATPYNVTVPLALLKLPAGALTGLTGIILLSGEFVPGFSAVDKSVQILAYALVFGFAQQLFTQYLDQRAQRLVNSVPTKARGTALAEPDEKPPVVPR